jgi:hypothetical protein
MMTANAGEVPDGWGLAGSAPKAYEVDVVAEANSGKSSARYRSTKKSNGFGTLMQTTSAADFLGKRVRMTAFVKSEDVGEWAGLWLRVDGHRQSAMEFDNMRDRPIQGTSSWNQYEIVLDVPKDAANLAFGILLDGEGTVWLDDLSFEVVPDDTPKTGVDNTRSSDVVNGSFESN